MTPGIAGYFESLLITGAQSTLGGWDCPRIQYARYRALGMRDLIAFDELRRDGRAAAQQNADLARWYAFSIAYTHALLNGTSAANRRWVFQQLATLYQIPIEVPDAAPPASPERQLIEFLTVDDSDLTNNPTQRIIKELCLAGCEVSPRGLASVNTSKQCRVNLKITRSEMDQCFGRGWWRGWWRSGHTGRRILR